MSWEKFWQSIVDFFLKAPEGEINNLTRIILAIIFAVAGHFLIKFILFVMRRAFGIKTKIQVDISAKSFILSVTKIGLNICLFILVLSTLNVDMTSVAAIFSAATVAIGLSLQNLISAFASGVVLLRVKHFKTGDYISVSHSNGVCEGTVKQVSIISTSLETVDNQVIIIPNNKLLEGTITNFTSEKLRRAVMKVNLKYDEDIEKVRKVLFELIDSDKRITKDPKPNIHISNLGEYSIELAIKYYVQNDIYWDVYNSFYEKILMALRSHNIYIAEKKLTIETNN